MTKKNIEFMIYGDDPQKIKRKKIKISKIILIIILGIAVAIFAFFAEDLYLSIDKNIKVVKRLDTKIANSKKELSALQSDYSKLSTKIGKVDSLNEKTQEQNEILIPDLEKPDEPHKFDNNSLNPDIDSLLRESNKQLSLFTKLTKTFNQNATGMKHYPSKYPVKEITLIRKYQKYLDPMTGTRKAHRGLDFGGKTSDIVMSTAEGKIVDTGNDKYHGKFIEISHNDSISSFYSHLNSILVKKEQSVSKGEKIGMIGNSGISTSFHLHFEIRIYGEPQDPLDYIILDK